MYLIIQKHTFKCAEAWEFSSGITKQLAWDSARAWMNKGHAHQSSTVWELPSLSSANDGDFCVVTAGDIRQSHFLHIVLTEKQKIRIRDRFLIGPSWKYEVVEYPFYLPKYKKVVCQNLTLTQAQLYCADFRNRSPQGSYQIEYRRMK